MKEVSYCDHVQSFEVRTNILDLVLVQPWQPIGDHPRQGAAKVNHFVHNKGHDARGEDVVLHVGVPRYPHPLHIVEMRIVLGYLVELAPVGVWLWRKEAGRHC